jgi:hypothetical protein
MYALPVGSEGGLGLDPEMGIPHYLRMSYAPSTNRIDAGYWAKWEAFCSLFPTPPLRAYMAAHTGADPDGYAGELRLQALFLLFYSFNIKPRAHADPAALPGSSMQALRGVFREHQKHGIAMAPSTLAGRVLKGMQREHVLSHGIRPTARKLPLTNTMILMMLATPCVTYLGLTCDWDQYFWIATCAWVSTLSEEGSRKEAIAKPYASTPFERGRLTFASLVWLVDGGECASPTRLLLAGMQPGRGDGVYLKYGRAKNDQFGVFFASTPSFLPFDPHAPRNACRALAALEVAAAVDPARRGVTPLFGPSPGEEFTCGQVDKAFELMMLFGARVPAAQLHDYSVHSFRIWLACALLAAQVDWATIKRTLRWRGDESLLIYARLNNDVWARNVFASYTAVVNSTVAARLPRAVGVFDLDFSAVVA